MANVARHASTHRFSFVGGTDPLNVELPGAETVDSSSHSITADVEWEWDTVTGNNDQIFRWDPTDPAGILIQSDGFFVAWVTVDVASIDQAVDRGIRLGTGTVSGGSGNTFGSDHFSAGKTAVDSGSALPTVQEPTTRLWYWALQGYFGVDPEDPIRVVLAHNHMGSNYSVTNQRVFIVRISTLDGFGVPPPYVPT